MTYLFKTFQKQSENQEYFLRRMQKEKSGPNLNYLEITLYNWVRIAQLVHSRCVSVETIYLQTTYLITCKIKKIDSE